MNLQYAVAMIVVMVSTVLVLGTYSLVLEGRIMEGASIVTEGAHQDGLMIGGMLHVAEAGEFGVITPEEIEELDLENACNPDIPVFNENGAVGTDPVIGEECEDLDAEFGAPVLYMDEEVEVNLMVEVGGEEE